MADGQGAAFAHLWAPWRSAYVSTARDLASQGCLFCRLGDSQNATEDLRLFSSDAIMVVLNRFPYSSGHLMVAPRSHLASPIEASAELRHAFYNGVVYCERVLRNVYRPDGINVGMNLGEAAGAGVPTHFHMHLVPRFVGDTNFMGTFAMARVHPESLERGMERLAPFFRREVLDPIALNDSNDSKDSSTGSGR